MKGFVEKLRQLPVMKKLKQIFVIPSAFDPDDLRRRQVINAVMIVLITIVFLDILAEFPSDDITRIIQGKAPIGVLVEPETYFVPEIVMLLVMLGLLALNRSSRVPKNLVGWIFIFSTIGALVA